MLTYLMCMNVLVASSISASVLKDTVDSCSPTEFACGDGGCVSMDLVCDGSTDCADGGDELNCDKALVNLDSSEPVLHRYSRQAVGCRKDQWQCRDGSCISFDGKCDGIVNCLDGSDETHALCRNTVCHHIWFRCTYGACVDGTAPCNGIKDCADESDELLPRCRNETDEVRGQFKCLNGSTIPATSHCDGTKDCPDGSDETVRTCGAKKCAGYLFQCAYGACVDRGADCNKIEECADGSDEAFDLCGTSPTPPPVTKPQGPCVLPPYPIQGTYVTNKPNAKPGDSFDYVTINVTCKQGYGVDGSSSIYCFNGMWPESIPKCVSQCRLTPHPSVEYECLVFGQVRGSRNCNLYEPTGTVVRPQCKAPNYYSPTSLPDMRCINGNWDYTARCSPDCGTVTPDGTGLIVGGNSSKKGEVPWHAGIYTKTTIPYKQICGGSLISRNIIISAAHCFWSNELEKQLPTDNYAAAVGKLYRPWDNPRDEAQKSDIKEIHLPVRFLGSAANYQDDIAIVIVKLQFEYKTFIRPVCVDFDINFERRQLLTGHSGKVAGWGLTDVNSNLGSPVLKVIDLPYVDTQVCIAGSPPSFRGLVTSDKFCAGFQKGNKAVCHGDSGGGLAFPEQDKGQDRYYLRGIVSTAPDSENEEACNANTYTTFTQILKHEQFIRQFWGFEL